MAEGNRLVFLAVGFDPLRTLDEQRWFPKPRYEVMRPYLASRGARAWDMMTRTCSVQTNLDYGSPEDLCKKFLVGNRLAPIVTAIFANSPFEDGRPSGYKSTRAAAWLDTDPDRAGTRAARAPRRLLARRLRRLRARRADDLRAARRALLRRRDGPALQRVSRGRAAPRLAASSATGPTT